MRAHFGLWLCLVFLTACHDSSQQAACSAASPIAGSENAQTALTTPIVANLSGCTLIGYSTPITVGSTANINVLIDSGSSSLGVASTNCSNCTGISPLYNPSTSANYTCFAGSSGYLDGTGWVGSIVNDTVQLGTIPSVTASLTSIESQSASPASAFFSDSDCSGGTSGLNSSQGIMGLAGPAEAIANSVSYLDVLNAQQSFPEIFAVKLCMDGGQIWFGNYDSTYAAAAPAYTPITQSGAFFYVNLKDLSVTSSVGITANTFSSGLVLDTGSSISILPQSVFDGIANQVAANATFTANFGDSSWFSNGNCTQPTNSSLTPAQLDAALPAMTLTFQSTTAGTFTVTLPATRSYLDIHPLGGSIQYCPGMAPDGGSGPDIIGASFMRSQIVIFDRNSNRIGFAAQQPLGTSKGCSQ